MKKYEKRFLGRRFQCQYLCNTYCVVDKYPEDADYIHEMEGGVIQYFQKILLSLPCTKENFIKVNHKARELETKWLNSESRHKLEEEIEIYKTRMNRNVLKSAREKHVEIANERKSKKNNNLF